MRSMCVGVAETGVKAFLFLSFSFFSDKRKELYKKSIFRYLAGDHWSPAKPTKQKKRMARHPFSSENSIIR